MRAWFSLRCASLKRRIPRPAAALCSVFEALRNHAVKRAVRRGSAAQRGTRARSPRASMARA
eukprot:681510-Lingulodinium_polyedra.AAC.1